MKVRYNGETRKMLIHHGLTYDVKPGDELELDDLPDSPQFEQVKKSESKGVTGE